jgi:hypothetical protein
MRGQLSYRVVQSWEAPPRAVFDASLNMTRYPDWMPRFWAARSDKQGNTSTAIGLVRRIRLQDLTIREQATGESRPNLDPYAAVSSVPVRGYRADIRLEDRAGGCLIIWDVSFTSPIP